MPDNCIPPVSEPWLERDQQREGVGVASWGLAAFVFWSLVLGGLAGVWLS